MTMRIEAGSMPAREFQLLDSSRTLYPPFMCVPLHSSLLIFRNDIENACKLDTICMKIILQYKLHKNYVVNIYCKEYNIYHIYYYKNYKL